MRRGERTGTPASLPGRRIRAEETAPTMLCYAHRPPSPGQGLNTHGDKARAGRRGNTWGGVRGVRRRSSGGPSRQKMRPFRRVGGGGTSTEQVRAKHCRPEPQGARQSPDKDRVKTWSEHKASDHTGGSATRHESNRETWGCSRREGRDNQPPGSLGNRGGRKRGAEW